jgi:hypothetical protein
LGVGYACIIFHEAGVFQGVLDGFHQVVRDVPLSSHDREAPEAGGFRGGLEQEVIADEDWAVVGGGWAVGGGYFANGGLPAGYFRGFVQAAGVASAEFIGFWGSWDEEAGMELGGLGHEGLYLIAEGRKARKGFFYLYRATEGFFSELSRFRD